MSLDIDDIDFIIVKLKNAPCLETSRERKETYLIESYVCDQ